MAARQDETGIDRLFQLPIEEFTAARNALAKQAGSGAVAIRQLSKPPLAAWAVNQLYWQQRDTYDALISASEALRRTHKAVLGGRSGDLRAAGREHDQALDRALKATMAIVTGAGHPATDTTRQAVISTLRALPADEPPGRLTRTLQPGGFEMLAGFSLGGAVAPKPVARVPERHDKEPKGKPSKAEQARHAKELARAKQGASAAAQALQRAEHDAKREEFERARTAREADKATAAVERARAALDEAQQELEEAERAAKAALANQQRAERRASAADASLETARQNAEAARSALAQLER